MASEGGADAAAPYELRVKHSVPHVRDFDRNAEGDVILSSLRGPARIEVRARGGGAACVGAGSAREARRGRGVCGGRQRRGRRVGDAAPAPYRGLPPVSSPCV